MTPSWTPASRKYKHGKITVIGKYADYSYRNGKRTLLVSDLRTTFFSIT